jgi:MraZ protein
VDQTGPASNTAPVELPRGRHSGRLDDKGRLKLPAAFVQFFESLPEKKLFLTSLDRSIAQLYPIAEWRVNEKFFSDFRANPGAARRTLFNANDLGADVEMDSQGRITVPASLRRDLKMEGEDLHLMAYKGHLEILTETQYQARKSKAIENTAADLEVLEMAGLR